ncbi:hypothetical protein ACFV8E_20360 [Streptomyces sp. NPDC059849]
MDSVNRITRSPRQIGHIGSVYLVPERGHHRGARDEARTTGRR